MEHSTSDGLPAGTDAAPRLARVEERLAALEAESGILRTLYTLAQTIDYGDHPAWLDCFTPDGAFEMVEVDGATRTTKVRHEGRAALAGFIPGHSAAPDYYHKHLTTVPIITLDGPGSAAVTSYFARIDHGDEGPFLWSFGRYLDRLALGADGRWRVSERVLEVESRTRPVRAADIGSAN